MDEERKNQDSSPNQIEPPPNRLLYVPPPESSIARPGQASRLLYVASALSITAFILASLTAVALYLGRASAQRQLDEAKSKIVSLERQLRSSDEELDRLRDNLDAAVGMTLRYMEKADGLSQQIERARRQQSASLREIEEELSEKADAAEINRLRSESIAKLDTISGDVSAVRSEMGDTRKELELTRRELVDVRETVAREIARNREELAALKQKGIFDYFEFDINNKAGFQRVGDILVAVKKTDPKKKQFDILVSVDDNVLEKKSRTILEPVQFLVGKRRLRYELVVFDVKKNQITGYLSMPRDKRSASEVWPSR